MAGVVSARRQLRGRVIGTVALLVAISAVGPFGSAQGATGGVDQLTGVGNTDSAVTISWAGGITGADNKTVVTPRPADGPGTYIHDMWNSYKGLKVTVSKTRALTHEGL